MDLAERYGLAKQTVDAIRQGRIWEAVTRDVRRPKRPYPPSDCDLLWKPPQCPTSDRREEGVTMLGPLTAILGHAAAPTR
jgi:hypothetical protein